MHTAKTITVIQRNPRHKFTMKVNENIISRSGLIRFLYEQNGDESIILRIGNFLNAKLIRELIKCDDPYIIMEESEDYVEDTLHYLQCDFPIYQKYGYGSFLLNNRTVPWKTIYL